MLYFNSNLVATLIWWVLKTRSICSIQVGSWAGIGAPSALVTAARVFLRRACPSARAHKGQPLQESEHARYPFRVSSSVNHRETC